MPRFGRFCVVWLCAVTALLALVGVFDVVVDPWLVFGSPRIAGLNASRPETDTHTRLAKASLSQRAHPAGLMLGDSKVDIGLDPRSPAWPDDARPVFNYGLPGARLTEALANLQRGIAAGPVKRVLLLVELREIMAVPTDPIVIEDTATPSVWPSILARTSDVALATLSIDALRGSVATVLAQHLTDPVDMTDEGSTGEGGFRGFVRADGADRMFVQKDAASLAAARRLAAILADHPASPLAAVDVLGIIAALCRDHGIALDYAIAPSHADALDSYKAGGVWARYEAAKRAVTMAAAASGTPLWDFSGYDQFSTEEIPPAADRNAGTRWFWEPSHFKKELGELMLQTLYRGGVSYGVRLTPLSLDSRLETQREAQAAYAKNNAGWQSRSERAEQ